MADHAEFQKLCALFSTGELSVEESTRLNEHLAGCKDCRSYLAKFAKSAIESMSELAAKYAPQEANAEAFDVNSAKKRLLEKIKEERKLFQHIGGKYAVAGVPIRGTPPGVISWPVQFAKSLRPYLPYAAGFFVALGLSLTFYWNGPRTRADEFRLSAERAENEAAASRQEVKLQSQQREALNAELQQRTDAVVALRKQIKQLQQHINTLESDGAKAAREKQALQATEERLSKNLLDAQGALAALKNELESSSGQHANDSFRIADLERRAEQLSASIKNQREQIDQKDAELEQQRDLLAYDRDIRELMGAHELYVAEVSDSDENGRPMKPRARVFYTKDRSLIYYGFDLDREPGAKKAAAFQVWGQRGSNRDDALSLGILYQDASTNKRWILKIDDPMKLQRIDAVFVTVEPKGGSAKPTGRPRLFAYLRVNPNHP